MSTTAATTTATTTTIIEPISLDEFRPVVLSVLIVVDYRLCLTKIEVRNVNVLIRNRSHVCSTGTQEYMSLRIFVAAAQRDARSIL